MESMVKIFTEVESWMGVFMFELIESIFIFSEFISIYTCRENYDTKIIYIRYWLTFFKIGLDF